VQRRKQTIATSHQTIAAGERAIATGEQAIATSEETFATVGEKNGYSAYGSSPNLLKLICEGPVTAIKLGLRNATSET
jgi:hypothetical protein